MVSDDLGIKTKVPPVSEQGARYLKRDDDRKRASDEAKTQKETLIEMMQADGLAKIEAFDPNGVSQTITVDTSHRLRVRRTKRTEQ